MSWTQKVMFQKNNNIEINSSSDFLLLLHTFKPHLPVAKAMPKHVVNPVMARMSSKLPAAIRRVGIPCSTPYPSFCSISIDGTTTAGDTAPSTNLRCEENSFFIHSLLQTTGMHVWIFYIVADSKRLTDTALQRKTYNSENRIKRKWLHCLVVTGEWRQKCWSVNHPLKTHNTFRRGTSLLHLNLKPQLVLPFLACSLVPCLLMKQIWSGSYFGNFVRKEQQSTLICVIADKTL